MKPQRVIKRDYESSVKRIAGKYERVAGWIGLDANTIETGIPDLIYVRLVNGQAVKAVNNLAPLVYNYPVEIARNDSSAYWEVVALRQPYSVPLQQVKSHHSQHEYPASDTVWVRDAQFMPLLILPASGMVVAIFGGVVRAGGQYYAVENQSLDLTASVPATGAKWALIEVVAGVVTVTLSAEYAGYTDLLPSNIPLGSGYALCAIRLYAGQTLISRNSGVNDFVDLRFTKADAVLTLGELGDVDIVTPANGEVLTYDSYTGLWVNSPLSVGTLDGLSDVDIPSPADGEVLTYDSYTGLWVASAPAGGGALDDLTDVDVPSPTDGQVLTYDSYTSLWVAADAAGGAVWGSIAGTLSDQIDLNSALNARLVAASNLSDVANAGTARTNLGLVAGGAGDIWVEKAGNETMTGPLTVTPSIPGNSITATGEVTINTGANAEPGLTIVGNGFFQTGKLLTINDNYWGDRLTVDKLGQVYVQLNPGTTDSVGLQVNSYSTGATFSRALQFAVTGLSASHTYLTGFAGLVGIDAYLADAYANQMYCGQLGIYIGASSGKTVTWTDGVGLKVDAPSFAGTGTISGTNLFGVRILNQGNSNNTNSYGIWIDDQSGSSTLNYSIYTKAGDIRLMASGSDKIGFHGASPIAQQTVSGSRGGNAALADLLTKLANIGLIVDSTS